MHRWMIAFVLILSLLAAAGEIDAQEGDELIKAGDTAYLKRSENPEAVQTAIKKWEHASMVDSNDPSPMYKIAMAYCFLGRFAQNPDGAEKLFTQAHEYAKKAVEKDGKCGPAHYWWAVSLYRSVEKKNKFAKLAVQGDVTSHFLTAKSLDPDYYFAGPDRGLAALFLNNPVPTVALARKHIDDSLGRAPTFSANLLLAAQILIKEGRLQEARPMLKAVLEQKPLPGFAKELEADQKAAQSLLDQMKQH